LRIKTQLRSYKNRAPLNPGLAGRLAPICDSQHSRL
jgi:hypothetical protein